MVLEPLRFLTDRLRPARGLLIAEIDHAFPCSPVAERVAVVLGEAVDEIDLRHGILDPADVESVELPQIAATVIVDQRENRLLLRLSGHFGGLAEPIDDFLDRRRVHAAHFPYPLDDSPVGLLDQFAVQAPRNGRRIVRIHPLGIEPLDLFLRDPLVVVVGRRDDQVLALGLVDPLGHHGRIENHRLDLSHDLLHRAEVGRKILSGSRGDQLVEISFRKLGMELVGRIVMVNAVGEPHFLEVLLEPLERLARPVARVPPVNRFERAAYAQIVPAVLVEQDVAARQGGLAQVVDQLLLVQRKRVEARNAVFEHLDIVEAVGYPVELLLADLFLTAGVHTRSECCHKRNRKNFLHTVT